MSASDRRSGDQSVRWANCLSSSSAPERTGITEQPQPMSGPYASGAPGIFIDQAARVGARTIFCGAVGDDAFGQVLLDRLRVGRRLRCAGSTLQPVFRQARPSSPTIRTAAANSSSTSRTPPPRIFPVGEAAIASFASFGLDGIPHFRLDARRRRKWQPRRFTSAGRFTSRASRSPSIRTYARNCLPIPSYLDTVKALLAISTFVLPSAEDAAVLFPGESLRDVFSQRLHEAGARYVVLKRGEAGCIGSWAGRSKALPSTRTRSRSSIRQARATASAQPSCR